MFAEIALFLTARTAPGPSRLRLAREAVSLWSRRRRCRAEWEAHERECHRVVTRAVNGLPARNRVVVLGSGLVRDVPIEDLAAGFREVVLVDAVHLLATRLRLIRHRHVRFVWRDLSGCARWLKGEAEGREAPAEDLLLAPDTDLVISANLLSQLPRALAAWAERHPSRAPMPADALARAAVGWHLADLAACRARVCLLTDTLCEVREDGAGVQERLDLLHGHALPPPDAQWLWTVAPPAETRDGTSLVHHARGYADFAAACARAS